MSKPDERHILRFIERTKLAIEAMVAFLMRQRKTYLIDHRIYDRASIPATTATVFSIKYRLSLGIGAVKS